MQDISSLLACVYNDPAHSAFWNDPTNIQRKHAFIHDIDRLRVQYADSLLFVTNKIFGLILILTVLHFICIHERKF